MCSKTCLPWQGKVYIDDVFTVWDGEKRDGMGKSKYCGKWFPLLSVAMEAGLFHPNCRHTMSLWIEGVSKMPEPLNEAEIKEKSAAEQKQRELERKIRKHKRQVVGSTDEENVKEAKKKLREAQKKLKELIDEHDELRRDYDREKIYDTAPSQPQETPQKLPEQSQSEIIPQEKEVQQSVNMSVSEEAANEQQKQAETLPDVQTSSAAKTASDIPETAQESQQENVAETVDKSAESGIMEEKAETAENDVYSVGRLDRKIYKCVSDNIVTDEVIITDERINHIKERHPNDYEKYYQYLKEIVEHPEYIIEANKPQTALILKSFSEGNEVFKTVLRLVTSNDDPMFKNSIITFMKINEKEWQRLIKNKKILYKSEYL